MRDGHPASEDWGLQAWLKYPHVIYAMSGAAARTIQSILQAGKIERHVGLRIPELSGVAPVLSRTDMLFTTTVALMVLDLGIYGLGAAEPPLDLPDIAFGFLWSSRRSNDPGNTWLRSLVFDVYDGLLKQADAFLESTEILGRT